ncbi:uncharacterized protein LOC124650419 [Lolium rigidum]|uniref:uncharacterized protein LOC124650419 n=1 Tax=Lolium rigidum TaxID=89674 RepID=UPI001F5DE47C|nr:uncharacterized protein LOC124650419 [Lolium rigidum]
MALDVDLYLQQVTLASNYANVIKNINSNEELIAYDQVVRKIRTTRDDFVSFEFAHEGRRISIGCVPIITISILHVLTRVQEEDSSKASSSELGPTTSDTLKFETLSLNDSPPALDSSDRSEEPSIADLLLNQPTFDSVDDCMDYFCNSERAARAARDKVLPFSQQPTLDKFEAERVLVTPNQAQPVRAQEQASAVAAQGRYEGSKGKIADNGNRWMSEELWVAFQKYLQKEDDLKEFDCEFEELKHQCFHVENYCKIFHHFNFTVKMKKHGSSEWTSTLYFAEVKEIFRRKIYFCCPLEQHENGMRIFLLMKSIPASKSKFSA